jgi:hypothetical protein
MILNSLERIFLFILWIIAVIWLILIITFRKRINEWLRREKKNKVMHFNIENYYKLDLGKKKYYYLKTELAYLKEILKKEDLELVVIEEIKKLIILRKDEKIDISEYLDEYYEPKVKCLNFQSNIEMVETKPREIIINI